MVLLLAGELGGRSLGSLFKVKCGEEWKGGQDLPYKVALRGGRGEVIVKV